MRHSSHLEPLEDRPNSVENSRFGEESQLPSGCAEVEKTEEWFPQMATEAENSRGLWLIPQIHPTEVKITPKIS